MIPKEEFKEILKALRKEISRSISKERI